MQKQTDYSIILGSYERLLSNYSNLISIYSNVSKKLSILESLNNLESLPISTLENLESHFLRALDKVKETKIRNLFQKELTNLRERLGEKSPNIKQFKIDEIDSQFEFILKDFQKEFQNFKNKTLQLGEISPIKKIEDKKKNNSKNNIDDKKKKKDLTLIKTQKNTISPKSTHLTKSNTIYLDKEKEKINKIQNDYVEHISPLSGIKLVDSFLQNSIIEKIVGEDALMGYPEILKENINNNFDCYNKNNIKNDNMTHSHILTAKKIKKDYDISRTKSKSHYLSQVDLKKIINDNPSFSPCFDKHNNISNNLEKKQFTNNKDTHKLLKEFSHSKDSSFSFHIDD